MKQHTNMNKLPDYSEYLNKPGMLEYIEQEWLRNPHIHDAQAAFVNKVIPEMGIKSIIEFGCSTGNLASRITGNVKYRGIDSNGAALEFARTKCPGKTFIEADLRTFKGRADLIICFAFLKHFSLHELPDIMKKLQKMGKYVIFDMPLSETPFDNGDEFHHTWADISFFNVTPIAIDDISNPLEPIYLI